MENIRVIIADDQHLFAEGLKYVLEGESRGKVRVLAIAENGQIAIEHCRNFKPDLVLMDIRMPKMDGVQAVSVIKKEFPNIKTLVLTTFDDDELAYQALHNGATGFVLKNIEPVDLVLAIQAVLGGGIYISPSVGIKLIGSMRHKSESETLSHKDLVARISAVLQNLTLREAEVLALVIHAERNSDIAAKLYISEKTVKNHISNIYDKLNIHNRLQLISYAAEIGIIKNNEVDD